MSNPDSSAGETLDSKLVWRGQILLKPNNARVIMKPFNPPTEEQARHILARIMMLSEEEVCRRLGEVLADFSDRHRRIADWFQRRYEQVRYLLVSDQRLTPERQLLVGAYFSHEYSLEAAALFNPSIVLHPDQSGLSAGSLRFVLSLRATGEGHISSITFRGGTLDPQHQIQVEAPSKYAAAVQPVPNPSYEKALFHRKLRELGMGGEPADGILAELPDVFSFSELDRTVVAALRASGRRPENDMITRGMLLLARSNYEVEFPPEFELSERVLFPASPSQINGIEDARFVRFQERNGDTLYYATYTAYDGRIILPQLLETRDFRRFRFSTLNGPAAQNKGMALFPRRIGDLYAMIARVDGENLSLMYSDNLHFWYEPRTIARPTFPWEAVQIGNCGSPVETERGWLLLTHGVGPMRKYCMGAILLDLEDPSRVIGRLEEPLIVPQADEREGYVPNVVYSCGCLLHGDVLIIPYGLSDYSVAFASAPVSRLLDAMK